MKFRVGLFVFGSFNFFLTSLYLMGPNSSHRVKWRINLHWDQWDLPPLKKIRPGVQFSGPPKKCPYPSLKPVEWGKMFKEVTITVPLNAFSKSAHSSSDFWRLFKGLPFFKCYCWVVFLNVITEWWVHLIGVFKCYHQVVGSTWKVLRGTALTLNSLYFNCMAILKILDRFR